MVQSIQKKKQRNKIIKVLVARWIVKQKNTTKTRPSLKTPRL